MCQKIVAETPHIQNLTTIVQVLELLYTDRQTDRNQADIFMLTGV